MSHLPLRRSAATTTGLLAPLAALALTAVLASPAVASEVPAAGLLQGRPVTSSPAVAPSTGPKINPVRVSDPRQYAADKAAADAAYQRWLATHRASLDLSGPISFAPAVVLNKPGMNFAVDKCPGTSLTGCNTPPDTTGAIGPTAYVEFVNSQVAVFNRSTLASTSTTPEDTFTGSTNTCDGQIKFDQKASRWVYWSLDCSGLAGANGFSFGWSKTSSPTPLTGSTANWCKFHFATDANLEDYGKLGNYDGGWIVGANEFPDAGGSNISVFALPKPAAGSKACPRRSSYTAKLFHPSKSLNSTPEPANISGSSAAGFIPARDAVVPSTHLRMLRMTGTTVATYALFQDASIAVPSYTVPPSLPEPGGGKNVVDTLDARMTQAAAAKDPKLGVIGIWTQHTVRGPGNAGSVVRWYELKDGQTTPVQTGTVSPLTTGAFAFNGAISPTTAGNAAALNYNTGSATVKIQLFSRIHAPGAAAGATSNQTLLGSSSGIVNDFSCPSHTGVSDPCRWGDYAGASFDPLKNTAVWGTGELTGNPDTSANHLARWLTRNFEVTVQ